MDNINPFDNVIDDGFYYVETDNVSPMRKNGFYSRPMIEFCLEKNIPYIHKSTWFETYSDFIKRIQHRKH
jgi:hypothetical protein